MFWLFRMHNKLPHEYQDIPFFERMVVRAFLRQEIQQFNESMQ